METPQGGLGSQLPVSTGGGGGITKSRSVTALGASGPIDITMAGGTINPPVDSETQADNSPFNPVKGDTTPGYPAIYFTLKNAGLYVFTVDFTLDSAAGAPSAGYFDYSFSAPIDYGAGIEQFADTVRYNIAAAAASIEPWHFHREYGPLWCAAGGVFPVGVGVIGSLVLAQEAGAANVLLTAFQLEVERLA